LKLAELTARGLKPSQDPSSGTYCGDPPQLSAVNSRMLRSLHGVGSAHVHGVQLRSSCVMVSMSSLSVKGWVSQAVSPVW
jgi:hypothetical protein